MDNNINNLSAFTEIEQELFWELQTMYQNILVPLLEEVWNVLIQSIYF